MMNKKKHAKKGFTLFEMLAAIAVLALLGVMITVGSNLATKSLNKSMYISNSALLGDTLNKAIIDVLRFSTPGDATESGTNVRFTCDTYGVINGYFEINENGLLDLNYGKAKIHDNDGNTVVKSPELIVNIGTYAGLKVKDLSIRYDTESKTYSGAYTIMSEELDLEKNCDFTVKPFDIKYQQGLIIDDDGNIDDSGADEPEKLCSHVANDAGWTDNHDGRCAAVCKKCGITIYKRHVINPGDIDELKKKMACGEVRTLKVNCGNNCGYFEEITIESDIQHILVYEEFKSDDPGDTVMQHTVRCTREGCAYTAQEECAFTVKDYNESGHTRICVCGKELNDNHTIINTYFDEEYHVTGCEYCDYKATNMTPHDTYIDHDSSDNDQHTIKCRSCNMNLVEKHNLSYINRDDSGHTLKCSTCDYSKTTAHTFDLNTEASKFICRDCKYEKEHVCSYDYKETGAVQHKYYCTVCGKIYKIEDHTFEYRTTETTHERYCTVCGYVILSEKAHTKQYTQVDGNSHKITCKDCGYSAEEHHNFTYKFLGKTKVTGNNTETHEVKCSGCGYSYYEQCDRKNNCSKCHSTN